MTRFQQRREIDYNSKHETMERVQRDRSLCGLWMTGWNFFLEAVWGFLLAAGWDFLGATGTDLLLAAGADLMPVGGSDVLAAS